MSAENRVARAAGGSRWSRTRSAFTSSENMCLRNSVSIRVTMRFEIVSLSDDSKDRSRSMA